jgi:anti-sigma B factor antagonist
MGSRPQIVIIAVDERDSDVVEVELRPTMHPRPHRMSGRLRRRWEAPTEPHRGQVITALAAPPLFQISECHLRGCSVMFVRGEIDLATVNHVESSGTRLLADAGRGLVVDLSETTFMDVGGVRVLERLSRSARENGGPFVVVACHDAVLRILALAARPQLAATSDLDTALEAVLDRIAS